MTSLAVGRRVGWLCGCATLAVALCISQLSGIGLQPAHGESADTETYNWDTGYDPSARQTQMFEGEFERPMLGERTEDAMLQAIAHYQIIVRRGGWEPVHGGQTLVVGSRGERVEQLIDRLMISGDLVPGANFDRTVYDQAVFDAVQNFQTRHGLLAHGKVDDRTRLTLNVPASVRLQMLEINLDRVREYASELSSRYVVVNIPATELEIVQDGYLYSRHVTIVGKVDRPSPEVSSQITQLNFNPYWHAPPSIVEKDILPQLRQGTSYIKDLNIRVFEGSYYGEEVDPDSIDWSQVDDPNRYFFRQEPGENNAMATVRINFPNDHAVYLHDTPNQSLFLNAARYDSSGCVRVDDVGTFVEWLLQGEDGWNRERIEQLGQSREREDADLRQPVPLRIVYLTAWATANDDVHFRPDIYGRDGIEQANAAGQPSTAGSASDEQSAQVASDETATDGIAGIIEQELLTGSTRSGNLFGGEESIH